MVKLISELLPTGETVGAYRITGVLGRGGFGVVYRAEDLRIQRTVAVKTILADLGDDHESDSYQRFLLEMTAVRRIQHPNVIKLHETGKLPLGGYRVMAWYAMELLNGQTLQRYVQQRGPLPPGEACRIIRDAARGLHEAHSHGVIHRDIKPENIMLEEGGRVVVLDFGICRLQELAGVTVSGKMVGTARYVSPEHVMDMKVDARADVFALGAVLYFLLTGEHLRPEANLRALVKALRAEQDTRTVQANPRIPSAVKRLLVIALATLPEHRFATALEFANHLDALVGQAGVFELTPAPIVFAPDTVVSPAPDAAVATSTTQGNGGGAGLVRKPVSLRVAVGAVALGVVLSSGLMWSVSRDPAKVVKQPPPAVALEKLHAGAKGASTRAIDPFSRADQLLLAGEISAAEDAYRTLLKEPRHAQQARWRLAVVLATRGDACQASALLKEHVDETGDRAHAAEIQSAREGLDALCNAVQDTRSKRGDASQERMDVQ